jgi:hypothetical protein
LNPAEPFDVWRVMSPTSYQAAPPRETNSTRLGMFVQPELGNFSTEIILVSESGKIRGDCYAVQLN